MKRTLVKHYNLLDLARVYCACLVVFIHMGLPKSVSLVPCLARQAVPFFFLVSGFFFAKQADRKEDPLRFALKYAGSILIVYAAWTLLWLPYFIREYLISYGDRSPLYVLLVILRRILLAGAAQYWYLLVLAEGVLLLGLIRRFGAWRLGWILCVLGLGLHILYDLEPSGGIAARICKLFYTVFSWNCNVVMTGFPLLFLGAACARNEQRLQSLRRAPVGILYLVFVLLAFAVYGISYSHYGIPFWLIEALLLFLFCILPSELDARIPASLCRPARNLSSVIYLTHTAFLSLFGYIFQIWRTELRFLLCVLTACLLTWLVKKLNWAPLCRLMMVK